MRDRRERTFLFLPPLFILFHFSCLAVVLLLLIASFSLIPLQLLSFDSERSKERERES